MLDWWILFGLAGLLYLIECITWVSATAVAGVRNPFTSRWRCVDGDRLPGNDRGGWLIADPLAFSGSVILCRSWPIGLDSAGICTMGVAAGRERAEFIAFRDIRSVRAEFGDVFINDRRFARAGSAARAEYIAGHVLALRGLTTDERATRVARLLEDSFQTEPVATRWRHFRTSTRLIRVAAMSLFILFFAIAPAVLVTVPPARVWLPLLVALIMGVLCATGLFVVAHLALFPSRTGDRWLDAIPMILLPLSAMRAVDRLSRELFPDCDALVVLPEICGLPAALPVLRRQWFDLEQVAAATSAESNIEDDDAAGRCRQWFSRAQQAAAQSAAPNIVRALLAAPPAEEGMTSYCPRCHSQYAAGPNACGDCGGLTLQPL